MNTEISSPLASGSVDRLVRRGKFEFTAGILLCGKIRDYLEARRFEGMDIQWREGSGWIDRDWIVKGAVNDVMQVHRDIAAWINANHLDA